MQEGGNVYPDLRVIYWKGPEDLASKLRTTLVANLEADTRRTLNPSKPSELWEHAFNGQPERYQVVSPYRGEQFGTEHLNMVLQESVHGKPLDHGRNLGGIALFDKVIQVINRPRSSPAHAYNLDTGKIEKIVVYNGELGFTKPHGLDGQTGNYANSQIRRFQVVFSRKAGYRVNYNSESEVTSNLELAYVISVHKSQGSEFDRVYFVVPKYKSALLSRELFYTGLTRASRHCTLLIEEDISPLLSMRRPERSYLVGINSSLFGSVPSPKRFRPWGPGTRRGRYTGP